MAFGKKFDKNKLKLKEKRKQQNPLFKRKKFCRFTAANVEQVDYKDVDTLKTSSRKTARSCQHA
jgi:small subunit ribosomal protein S18